LHGRELFEDAEAGVTDLLREAGADLVLCGDRQIRWRIEAG
jgi:hypothetical protein